MTVRIHLGEAGPVLEGPERLAALYLWLRNEAPPHIIVRTSAGHPVRDPLTINWASFPLEEGLEAAKAHRDRLGKV
jgi:hypothetical protein